MDYSVSMLKNCVSVHLVLILITTVITICSGMTNTCNDTYTHSTLPLQHGSLRVLRKGQYVNIYGLVGRILICDNGTLREVCDDGWGIEDAQVVCRQFGYDAQGAGYCTGSCFGESTNTRGLRNVGCTGEESRLIDCPAQRTDTVTECANAGVICQRIQCLAATEHTHREVTPLSPGASGEGQQSRTAIGGGLGALAFVLALTLVGVVLGWVWHCRKNKTEKESLRMEPMAGSPPSPPDPGSPPQLASDHPPPEYAIIPALNPSTQPVGVATAPNPSYGTSLFISRPHPSAEPGSGRVCPNPSYAVPLPKQ